MPKALVIAYYWPPAGGPGVQRWLKFVKYLPKFGVQPIVYIPENPNYPIVDHTLIKEVPADLRVHSLTIREPYTLAKLLSRKKTKQISAGIIQDGNQSFLEKIMLWVRGNLFIPDARKQWVKPSVEYLGDIITEEGIDVLITTGPPHSLHLIGAALKERSGLRWIADFRDPWTNIGYHKKLKLTKRSQRKHKALERSVLNNSDQIIVTSNHTKKEFQAITNTPIEVITNGFDSDYKGNVPLDSNFAISHVGSLLSGRNPTNLWKVLAELIRELPDFAAAFKLQLAGVVSEEVLDSITSYGLITHTDLLGYVTHEEAVAIQQRAQLLLLVEIDADETVGILPGKLYEYMAARRPILAIGPAHWEAGKLIDETKTGTSFGYQDESELKNVILEWFQSYRKQELFMNQAKIDRFHRKELTKVLSNLIKWE